MTSKINTQRRLIREDLDGGVLAPPVREPAGTAVVYGATVLGGEALRVYDARQFSAQLRTCRLRIVPDRLHPRLVLPFAVLLWGAQGATNFQQAAQMVAGQTVDDALAVLERPLALPAPCGPTGRCAVRIADGRLASPSGGGEAEDVAAALLHGGTCLWWPGPRATSRVPDWAHRWMGYGRSASLSEDVLRTAAVLLRSAPSERVALLDRLAGVGADETKLRDLSLREEESHRHGRGFGNWKRLCHSGSRGTCSSCGTLVHPETAPCPTCSTYPHGPDPRSNAMDRLEMALGVTYPTQVGR